MGLIYGVVHELCKHIARCTTSQDQVAPSLGDGYLPSHYKVAVLRLLHGNLADFVQLFCKERRVTHWHVQNDSNRHWKVSGKLRQKMAKRLRTAGRDSNDNDINA